MKSNTCFSKKTGEALSVYNNEIDALAGAKKTMQYGGPKLYPYLCERCHHYHLAPEDSKINVKHNACSCTDSNGNPKALYLTEADAEKQRIKSQSEQNVCLKIYPCNDGLGYHLTHCF